MTENINNEQFILGVTCAVVFPCIWIVIVYGLWYIYIHRKHIVIRARGYRVTVCLISSWVLCSFTAWIRMVQVLSNAVPEDNSGRAANFAVSFAAVCMFFIFSRAFCSYQKWKFQNYIRNERFSMDTGIITVVTPKNPVTLVAAATINTNTDTDTDTNNDTNTNTNTNTNINTTITKTITNNTAVMNDKDFCYYSYLVICCCATISKRQINYHSRGYIIAGIIIFLIMAICGLSMTEASYLHVITGVFSVITIYGLASTVLSITIRDAIAVRLEMLLSMIVLLIMFPLQLVISSNVLIQLIFSNLLSVALACLNVSIPMIVIRNIERAAARSMKKRSHVPRAIGVRNTTNTGSGSDSGTNISISPTNSQEPPFRLVDFLKRGPTEYQLFADFLVKCFASENLLFYQWIILFRKQVMIEFPRTNSQSKKLERAHLYDIDLSHLRILQQSIFEMIHREEPVTINNIRNTADFVMRNFIVENSEEEVNISFGCREKIKTQFNQGLFQHPVDYCDLFGDALYECYQLMQSLYTSNFTLPF